MRVLIVAIIYMLLPVLLFSNSGGVVFTVPEGYGAELPPEITVFDKFAFEIVPDDMIHGRFVREDSVFLDADTENVLRVRFFGNLVSEYTVDLAARPLLEWYSDHHNFWVFNKIPMIGISEDESIVVSDNSDGSVHIRAMPDGLKRGVPVAEVNLDMDIPQDILPENYVWGLLFELSAR